MKKILGIVAGIVVAGIRQTLSDGAVEGGGVKGE